MRTRPHCTRPTANSTRFFFFAPGPCCSYRVTPCPRHLSSVSTRLASLLFSSPPHLFPVLRGAHPSDKISNNRPSGRAWNWISGRTFCDLRPICLARFRVSRLPNTSRATARERKWKKRDSSPIVHRLDENPTRLIEREEADPCLESTSLNSTNRRHGDAQIARHVPHHRTPISANVTRFSDNFPSVTRPGRNGLQRIQPPNYVRRVETVVPVSRQRFPRSSVPKDGRSGALFPREFHGRGTIIVPR